MLQRDVPCDYVLGTGQFHSVEEFAQEAFSYAGLQWQKYVKIDSRYLRPKDVEHLVANSVKAEQELGWQPKVSFAELIDMMMTTDMEIASKEKTLLEAGYGTCNYRMK